MAPTNAPMRVANPFAKASGVNGFNTDARSTADADEELEIALDAIAADADVVVGINIVIRLMSSGALKAVLAWTVAWLTCKPSVEVQRVAKPIR